jgi:hypothetical protein
MSSVIIINHTAIDLVMFRLPRSEGTRTLPYDDATGLQVRAPKGAVTWGRGFNLEECGSPGLFDVMERYLLQVCHDSLDKLPWYSSLDPTRQSVCLEIEYNAGEHGLLGYHRMISCLEVQDWHGASAECSTSNPALKPRYARLADILETGEDAGL